MATQEFGIEKLTGEVKTNEDFLNKLYTLVGRKFEASIIVREGKVAYFSYNDEIKTGGTIPIEDEDEYGNIIISGYKEDYKQEDLTQEEIETINAWAQQNVEG